MTPSLKTSSTVCNVAFNLTSSMLKISAPTTSSRKLKLTPKVFGRSSNLSAARSCKLRLLKSRGTSAAQGFSNLRLLQISPTSTIAFLKTPPLSSVPNQTSSNHSIGRFVEEPREPWTRRHFGLLSLQHYQCPYQAERLIPKRLKDFTEHHQLLDDLQHGFWRKQGQARRSRLP